MSNNHPSPSGFQHIDPLAGECHVCSAALAGTATALCGRCDRGFHLRARDTDDGEDCGRVWLNEQYLAMDFICYVCLGERPEYATAEPPLASSH